MKTFLGIQKQIAFAILFFISLSHLTGQVTTSNLSDPQNPELFNFVSRSDINFSTEQAQKLDNMITNHIYLSHDFVEVNDLIQVQDDGQIYVNLPDRGVLEFFVGKNIAYLSPTEYTYYGELDPCDEQRSGYIHIIAENNNVYGQINIDDDIYELQDFGGRKNVIFKIDPTIYTDSECLVPHASNAKPKTNNNTSTTRSGGCVVSVLVLFTDAANQVGNPQNSANLFINQTNQSACNSDADIWFALAGVQELEGFTEETIGFAGQALINTSENLRTNSTANQLRNQFGADIVVLLTDGNWVNASGDEYFGVSFLNNWGDPDFAYAVVELDAAGGRFTFTHELVHNFGCKHNDDNNGAPTFVFAARGHHFSQGCCWPFRPTRRSIMNYVGGGSRIMHFSNPDVKYKGKKTGKVNSRDNEDQLSAEACTVSAYRNAALPFNATITGPNFGNSEDGPYTWCVDVTSCDDVADIAWEYSTDGFNYFPVTGSSLCWSAYLPIDLILQIRVTVTCSSGETDVAWYWAENTDSDPCHPQIVIENGNIDTRDVEPIDLDFEVYPIPSSDKIDVKFAITTSPSVTLKIVDISGRLVSEKLLENTHKRTNVASIDISDLRKGYYILSIFDGNKKRSKSIVKI